MPCRVPGQAVPFPASLRDCQALASKAGWRVSNPTCGGRPCGLTMADAFMMALSRHLAEFPRERAEFSRERARERGMLRIAHAERHLRDSRIGLHEQLSGSRQPGVPPKRLNGRAVYRLESQGELRSIEAHAPRQLRQ